MKIWSHLVLLCLPERRTCYEFLQAAGIRDEFTSLVTNASLKNIVLVEIPQYLKLTNIFVQSFNFIDDPYHPSVEFMLYEQPGECPCPSFAVFWV